MSQRNIYLSGFFISASQSIQLAALPKSLADAAVDERVIGFCVAALAIGSIVARLTLIKMVTDQASRKLGRIASWLVVISTLLMVANQAPSLLVFARILQGFGAAAYAFAAYAVLSFNGQTKERGFRIGLFSAAIAFGLVVSAPVGLVIEEYHGLVGVYYSAATLALPTLFLSSLPRTSIPSTDTGFLSTAYGASLWMIIIAICCFLAVVGAAEAFMPSVAIAIGADRLVLTYSTFGICLVIGRLFGGLFSDYVGRFPVAFFGGGFVALSQLIILYAALPPNLTLLVGAAFLGVGAGATTSSLMSRAGDVAPPNEHGKVVSLASVAADIGIAIGAVVAGWLILYGAQPLMLTTFGCSLVGLGFVIVSFIYRKSTP